MGLFNGFGHKFDCSFASPFLKIIKSEIYRVFQTSRDLTPTIADGVFKYKNEAGLRFLRNLI